MTQLFVASRKGLFQFENENNAWKIKQRSFLGQPVSAMAKSPVDAKIFAALNLGHFGVKLHMSDDEGNTWSEVNTPSYAGILQEANTAKNDTDNNQTTSENNQGPSLQLIWVLEFDNNGDLWAGTIPGGLFKSTDNGQSWELNTGLWNDPLRKEWFGGGYDAPGIHSICFDPRNDKHLAVAVSCGGVWLSDDGGTSWRVSTKGMKADYMPPEQSENPATQDPHRLVQCQGEPDTFWVQHHCGIFLSTDRCSTWKTIVAQPSSFGFAVICHPQNGGTAWFVPAKKDEFRIPVDGEFVINKTEDYGQTFTTIDSGLPQEESYDLIYRHALDIDPTGNIIAMGSTTGNLWVSENNGSDWSLISAYLPPIYALRFYQ